MNGAQLHQHVLANPLKTSREIAKALGIKPYNVTRECSRYPFIYIAGWKQEVNPKTDDYEWVQEWCAIEKPKDQPKPEGEPHERKRISAAPVQREQRAVRKELRRDFQTSWAGVRSPFDIGT